MADDEEEERELIPCTWSAELDASRMPTGTVRSPAVVLQGRVTPLSSGRGAPSRRGRSRWCCTAQESLHFLLRPAGRFIRRACRSQGTLNLPNGDVYVGPLVAGIRNGAPRCWQGLRAVPARFDGPW